MRVGFAGLGRMGAPMAARLVAAGHEVTVWTRDGAKARAFARAHGCAVAATPRAMAGGAQAAVSMLSDDAASRAVHLGDDGILAARPDHVLVMGTHAPDHIAELAAAGRVIDAPVSGSTGAAEAGTLLVMAGAGEADLAPLRPLLDAMARETVALGRTGAGAVMKLAVNALIHGLNQTVAEAVNLAAAAGIPPARAFEVIETSAAGAPMLGYRRPLYLDDRAHAVSFTIDLAAKDLRLFLDLANRHGVAAPQAALNREMLERAAGAGFGAADMAAMIRYLREDT